MKFTKTLGVLCGFAIGGAVLAYIGTPLQTIAQGVGQLGARQIWGNPTTGQNVARPMSSATARSVIGVPTVSATEDYGVKCDGATNDTAAINSALTGANGLVLVFPPNAICMVTPGIVIGNGASNVPVAMIGINTRFKAASVSASPILTIDSPENINAARAFAMQGFILNCDTKAAYGLKIHGSQTAAYRDLYITGACTAGGLWLSGEPSFGIYYNDFENIKIDTVTGPGLIAKSINNTGNYYIAANVFTGIQSMHNTTYGVDLDYASVAFTNSNFEANTTAGLNINNSIQVDLFGTHFESNNGGATAITTTASTKGLRVMGGRTIGSITASALIDPSNDFHTSDVSALPVNYLPGNIRAYTTGTYITGEIAGAFSASTVALAANTLYAFPLLMNGTGTWTTLATNITATGTALNLRLGIFKSGTDSLPSTLLIEAGAASAGTLGTKQIAFTQVLTPGLYYGVIVADGTVTVNAIGGGLAGSGNRYLEAIGVTAFNTAVDAQLSRAFTYGALSGASPFGAVTRAAANIPIIAVKK